MTEKKKLIEVALPLEAINAASAREKSIRHGHPSTLHLWWARRPLAAARAVIWSSLVDDPSSHPELFPAEEDQKRERNRLFDLLEKLVLWENLNNTELLDQAKEEIRKSVDGDIPVLLDPFAGGGAIPLEAQRLGLEAYASDLNPVAVMINKAMIEIPPKFAGLPPVNPEALASRKSIDDSDLWKRSVKGLAADIRYYGEWMKQEAFKRIGHMYPKVKVPKEQGGGEATVIAWIWARTVKCPSPACGCEMPLVNTFELSSKKKNEIHVEPLFNDKSISYAVKHGKGKAEGTVNRRGATCSCCGASVDFPYIREEGKHKRMGVKLIAIVAEGKTGRLYFPPNELHIKAANVKKPENYPDAIITNNPRDFKTPNYGLTNFDDLFSYRQLTALTTLSDLVKEAQKKASNDAVASKMRNDDISLSNGGVGATAYGEAIGVYLSFLVDKMSDYHSTISSWSNSRETIRNTFGRQAIPMVWDYAEGNPFSNSTGCLDNMLVWITKCVENLPWDSRLGNVEQKNAASDCGLRNIMISTDPPYYDNIGYADLSDYFYVWMRQSLQETYPKLFSTMLTPKFEELVATPHRFGGNSLLARDFFEEGMFKTFQQIFNYTRDDIPVTIYYAFKQSESEGGDNGDQTASTGWETMLFAIIRAGFTITGTWPIRTELANRTLSIASNALSSSIVLVCRKRPKEANICTRRDFINILKKELKPALSELQRSNIAPVDLAQSAIGPGMAVYSRYSQILEADGKPMGVRAALQIINQELDAFFSEQEGELDRESQFCVALYTQYSYNNIPFGDADVLARAKNTSTAKLADEYVLSSQKGIVRLLTREEIPDTIDPMEEIIWKLAQQLTKKMESGGIEACAKEIAPMLGSNLENAKSLVYRLFAIADKKGWTQEAFAYNSLIISWPDIQRRAAELEQRKPAQSKLF